MKGYRTILFNLLLAVGVAVAQYVLKADLTQLNPTVATLAVTGANLALRLITTSPVGKS